MKYRPEIDGLRAIAVLPVIFFHAGSPIWTGGFVGVDVFFVISGYLITAILLRELDQGKFSVINFYERRARRILPALAVVILTSILISWFLMTPSEFKLFSESVGTSAIFLSNFLFLAEVGYFSPDTDIQPLIHLWSLAVEEQFYLLFPLILWLTFRIGRIQLSWIVTLSIFVASAILCYNLASDYPDKIFFFSPARFWEILAGSAVALLLVGRSPWSNHVLSSLGLLAILGGMLLHDGRTPFPSIHTILAVGGTVLILAFGGRGSAAAKVLSLKPLVCIGLISYSAYLWHQPIFAFARMNEMGEPSWPIMVGLILMSLGLAFLTWKFVEKPFRSYQHPLYPKGITVAIIFGTLTAAMFLFGVVGSVTKGIPGRLPKHVQVLATAGPLDINPYNDKCELIAAEINHPVPGCLDYILNQKIDVVFLGDSHSGSISYEAQNELRRRGIGSYAISNPGCLGLPGFVGIHQQELGRCHRYATDIISFARNKEARVLIITSRSPLAYHGFGFDNREGGVERKRGGNDYIFKAVPSTGQSDFDRRKRVLEGIREQLSELTTEFDVILVGPIPEAGWKVPAMLARRALRGSEGILSTSYALYLNRTKDLRGAFATSTNARLHRLQMSEVLCDLQVPGRCLNELDGVSLYSDDDHLSNVGARLVAPKLANIVEKVLKN